MPRSCCSGAVPEALYGRRPSHLKRILRTACRPPCQRFKPCQHFNKMALRAAVRRPMPGTCGTDAAGSTEIRLHVRWVPSCAKHVSKQGHGCFLSRRSRPPRERRGSVISWGVSKEALMTDVDARPQQASWPGHGRVRVPAGVRERVRQRGRCRGAARGPQLAAARPARPVRRAAQRDRLHPAARGQPADLGLPDHAVRGAPEVLPHRQRRPARHPVRRDRARPEPAPLERAARSPTATPTSSTGSTPWPATATCGRAAGWPRTCTPRTGR